MKRNILIITVISLLILSGCGKNGALMGGNSVKETTPSGEGTGSVQSAEITPQKAKEIALAKVEGATEENIREFKKEFDDGIEKYEGEIIYNNTEYDFEIDAKSGKILQWETDWENGL